MQLLARLPIFLISSLTSIVLWFPQVTQAQDEKVIWHSVAEDLEHAEVTISTGVFSSAHFDLFRTSGVKYQLSVVRASEYGSKTSDAKSLCLESHSLLCINANFFDEQYRPLGLIIKNGILIQKLHKGGNTLTGVIEQTRDSMSIVNRLDFAPSKVLDAVQAGPRLIVGGQPVQGLHESKISPRRSGVCLDPDKHLIFFTVTSSFFGPPIEDIQKILLHKDIACWDALNLDGGSSTQLFFDGTRGDNKSVSRQIEVKGEDEIPVVLALTKRE